MIVDLQVIARSRFELVGETETGLVDDLADLFRQGGALQRHTLTDADLLDPEQGQVVAEYSGERDRSFQ